MKNQNHTIHPLGRGWQKTLLACGAVAYFTITTCTSFFYRLSLAEIALGCAIYALAVFPVLRWLLQRKKALPLMEAYMFLCILYYVHPILATNPNYGMWSETVRIQVNIILLVFLAIMQGMYFFLRNWWRSRPNRFLDQHLPFSSASPVIWLMLVLWVVLTAVQVNGRDLGTVRNLVIVMTKVAGLLSLFYLSADLGRGRLSVLPGGVLLTSAGFGIALQCACGFLNLGAFTMVVVLIGYTLGARKIPLLGVACAFAILSFLNLGKSEMRDKFWTYEYGQGVNVTSKNFFEIYRYWFGASWQSLIAPEIAPEKPLLNRLNLYQMIALSVDHFPSQTDYLRGETYSSYMLLAIPRFLWPDKPRVDGPSQLLAIATGIQTEETVESTGVSFGMISEAWANFGWYGIVGLACFLAVLLVGANWICAGRQTNTLGFIIGVSVLWSISLFEWVLGQWLLSLVQLTGLMIVVALVIGILRPARPAMRASSRVTRLPRPIRRLPSA